MRLDSNIDNVEVAKHRDFYHRRRRKNAMGLGDLQQMAMLAVARLGDEAYGAAIRSELRRVAGRTVSVQTVWVTLVRLEKQGLVASDEIPNASGSGGRPRRIFRLTPAGWSALTTSRASMDRLWEGVVQR